jgi:hypothetical protein
MNDDLYEADIVSWAEDQAKLLRRRAAGELINDAEFDWPHIAEEIEDVAGRHKDQIESRLLVACEHLLKWEYQPRRRTNSWRGSIVEARTRIARMVSRFPSLKDYPAKVLADAYSDGREKAMAETGLLDLPAECPWTIDQVLDRAFWPGLPWEADEP